MELGDSRSQCDDLTHVYESIHRSYLTLALLAWSPSSSMAFRTALPPAEQTGFPPNVLKCNLRDIVLAISSVVTTAAKGSPFPMPLAMVTMSGMTPCKITPAKHDFPQGGGGGGFDVHALMMHCVHACTCTLHSMQGIHVLGDVITEL